MKSIRLLRAIFAASFFVMVSASRAFAWKPVTHVYLANEVIEEAEANNGKVKIYHVDYKEQRIIDTFGEYELDPHIYQLITKYRPTFLSANFGPDAYPDIATGGMVIHADHKEEYQHGGPQTADWLEYLWRTGYKGTSQPEIQAWVLGYLSHAAGDMFCHTFLNAFAGGTFELGDGDNPARHIIFEAYIAKRQPGPTSYFVELPDVVGDYIWRQLGSPRKGNELRTRFYNDTFLKKFEWAEKMPPVKFGLYREWLEEIRHDSIVGKLPYISTYLDDRIAAVDAAERELVNKIQEFAEIFFFKKDPPHDAGLEGQPVFDPERAPFISVEKGDQIKELFKDYAANYIAQLYFPENVGPEVRETAHYIKEIMPEFFKEFLEKLQDDFVDYLFTIAYNMPYAQVKEYERFPERYFETMLNTLGRWENDNAVPIPIEEANHKYLKIKDDGYTNPDDRWQWTRFSPAFNTIQMLKMMYLKKSEFHRLMDDMRKLIEKDNRDGLRLNDDHLLLDGHYCVSIDSSMPWLRGGRMLVARGEENHRKYYANLFMHQAGEKEIKDPFVIERPPKPGAVITKISIAPRYMNDYRFDKKFKVKEFIEWFSEDTKNNRDREYAGAPSTYQDVRAIFKERHKLEDHETKELAENENLRVTVEYLFWGFPEQGVDVKVSLEAPIKKEEAKVWEEKKVKQDIKDDFVKGSLQLEIAMKDLREDILAQGAFDPKMLEAVLYLNDQVASSVHMLNAYKIESPEKRIKEKLDELERIVLDAEQRADETAVLCQEAWESLKKFEEKIAQARSALNTTDVQLRNLGGMRGQLVGFINTINTSFASAEKLTPQLSEIKSPCEEMTDEVCQIYEDMKKAGTKEERERLLKNIEEKLKKLEQKVASAKNIHQQVTAAFNASASAQKQLSSIKKLLEGLGLGDAGARLQEAESELGSLKSRLSALEGKGSALSSLKTQAEQIQKDLKEILEPIKETDLGMKSSSKLSNFIYRIEMAQTKASSCSPSLRNAIKEYEEKTRDKINERLKEVEGELAAVQNDFKGLSLEAAINKHGDVEYLSGLADGYRDEIEAHLKDARACAELARKLKDEAIEIAVPHIVGMKIEDAGNLLRQNHLVPNALGIGDAPTQDSEYTVKRQMPAAGTKVQANSEVTFHFYGKCNLVKVPNVVGMSLEDGAGRLRALGLYADARTLGDAVSKEREYKISSQDPGAGQMLEKGATVIVQYHGKFVDAIQLPNVTGMPLEDGASLLRGMGVYVNALTLGMATKPDSAWKIRSQNPQPGTLVKKGETVNIQYFSDFDTSTIDCSAYPGSRGVIDQATGRAVCDCAAPRVWNAARTECLDCSIAQNDFYGALNADNLDFAVAVFNASLNCPWGNQGRSDLDEAFRKRNCQPIINDLWNFANNCMGREAMAAQSMALMQGCLIPFEIMSQINAAIMGFPPCGGGGGGGGVISDDPLSGGRGHGVQLTQRTIVAYWNVTGSHPNGSTTTGHIQILENGTYTYNLNDTLVSQGSSKIDRQQGSGSWTLNGDALNMNFDRGGKYEGKVRGDAGAFTLSVSNNGWTLNFQRR